METFKIKPVVTNFYTRRNCFTCGMSFKPGGIDYELHHSSLEKPIWSICPTCIESGDIKPRITNIIGNYQDGIDFLKEIITTGIEGPTPGEMIEVQKEVDKINEERRKEGDGTSPEEINKITAAAREAGSSLKIDLNKPCIQGDADLYE